MLRSTGLAAIVLWIAAGAACAQQASSAPQSQAPQREPRQEPNQDQADQGATTAQADASSPAKPVRSPSRRDRRRAAKLFLDASKLFQQSQFEQALHDYDQAAALDPANTDYPLAAQVARSHAITALIQAAAKDRLRGDTALANATLQRAVQLDPTSPQLAEHVRALADDVSSEQPKPLYERVVSSLASAPALAPTAALHTFHLRSGARQLIETVFRAYGIEPLVDQSVRQSQVRMDLDNATFEQALHAVNIVTRSFCVPVDERHVLVANDTPANRQQFMRQEMETVYLSGLTASEMTSVGALAKNVFEAQQSSVQQNAGTMTIRAPVSTLEAFNATLHELLNGRSQVLLEVRLIELGHTNERNTGAQLPQQFTAFNVYAEEQSILNANQDLVQQIISSGLAAPGDTLAILGILLASGQVSSSLFSNGIALFGGGLTLSGLSPGPTKLNLSLNSSDTRVLDLVQLRLADDEAGTLLYGSRYPIMTSSFSDLGASSLNIPGLTGAGASGALSSLISSLAGAATTIPQVQYQNLGLTLKATPRLMRSGNIALTMEMKITTLAGKSVNGMPLLNNREYTGVVTLKENSAVVLMGEMNKEESRILSGTPGLTEIPGLNNLTGNDTQKNYATLLVIITPHVIQGPRGLGHSPMMEVERTR